ncbi:MAG TPA: hypothetical protein VFR84_02015 [Candidatus Angelobacter sp.]|nr:hypothetical protein [Candidatus Angelobacter sp.]
MKIKEYDRKLLEGYIASFAKLDEMVLIDCGVSTPESQLTTGEIDQYDRKIWRPLRMETSLEALQAIYQKLPARFPPLYEMLLLSYRWAAVRLGSYRLLANPPGPDLSGFLHNIERDNGLWTALIPSGFIQFGHGSDVDYDPVCFDIRSRSKKGDYRVVKIDHEEILCNNRIKVVAELAPSFEQLVLSTIERAGSPRTV